MSLNMRKINFPRTYARSVDFLPPLSLQDRFKGNEEYLYFSGVVRNIEETTRQVDDKTPLGGTLVKDKMVVGAYRYNVGSVKIDFGETPFTPKELLRDLENAGMEKPEAIIQERILIAENPPPKYDVLEPLSSADYVVLYQKTSGYNPGDIRRKVGIPVWRIKQNLLKPQLMSEGLWSRNVARRLRGIISTKSVVLTSDEATRNLDMQNVYTLQQMLVKDDWHRDVAMPITGPATVDTSRFGLSLYQLDKYVDSSRDRRALITLST